MQTGIIEWINNKVLLYSTGNYIQNPVINHNGREYEREYIHVYILFHIQLLLLVIRSNNPISEGST